MADGLDVVTVEVENKRAVIVGVIVRAQARRAVITRTSGDGGLVKGINQGARAHAKSDMNGRMVWPAFAQPEIRLGSFAEARHIGMPGD